jgi:hypothetical protein
VLWGINPVGYHLINLVLHVANTVVFYAIAVRLLAHTLPGMGNGIGFKLGGAVAVAIKPGGRLLCTLHFDVFPPILCLEDPTDALRAPV